MRTLDLLVDTSSPIGKLLFLEDGRVLHPEIWGPGTDHSEKLVLNFKRGLDALSINTAQIGKIYVGLGPGSFTGLRVCHAFCKATSFAQDIPIYGFPSSRLAAYETTKLFEELNMFCIVSKSVGNNLFFSHYKIQKNKWTESVSNSAIAGDQLLSGDNSFFSYDSFSHPEAQIEKMDGRFLKSGDFIDFCNTNSLLFCQSSHLDLTPLYLRQSEAEEKLKREDSKNNVTK